MQEAGNSEVYMSGHRTREIFVPLNEAKHGRQWWPEVPHPLVWSCLHVTYAQLHRETETDVPLNASFACHV